MASTPEDRSPDHREDPPPVAIAHPTVVPESD